MSFLLDNYQFKSVLKAIAHAELELAFLHGLKATDNDLWDSAFVIDNSDALQLISEANGILDTILYNHNISSS
ncbi:MAG: hypothetical protein II917_09515 [Synergistaceae bacterium]|nr:hypothetical protein [Synergistaceae bacterium]